MGNLLSETTAGVGDGGTFFSALLGRAIILNNSGIILATNAEWRLHLNQVGAGVGGLGVGANYLTVCRREVLVGTRGAVEALAGLESVLAGKCPAFTLAYARLSHEEGRWFQMLVMSLSGDVFKVAVIYLDLTEQSFQIAAKREAQDRFHKLVEASNLAYAMFDPLGDVLDINDSYLHLTGRNERDEIIGAQVLDWIPPADRQRLLDGVVRCAATGTVHRIEAEYHRGDGEVSVVGMNLIRIMAHGSPRVVAFCFDLTEQKHAAIGQRQAGSSEDRYRAVVEAQTELVCRYLPDTTLTFVNEAYCRFFRMTREELVGRRFSDFLPASSIDAVLATIARTISNRQPVIYEHEVTAPDHTVHWQEWVDIPIYDKAGNLIELQGIGRDITSQHRAEEELLLSHHHVHDLASRLMRAQEIERRSIARELHDDLSQRLAAHAIALSNLRRRMPELPDALEQRMAVLESEAMALGDSVRQISHQLHPAVLEQLGLPAALRSCCTEAGERSRLDFHVDAKDPDHVMSDQVALALYRVAQETIRNIERHARAKNVWVRLAFNALDAILEIRDDGVGFDSLGSKKRSGLGLISVEERIRFLNGRLTLESRPGAGTSVHVYIPQQKHENEAAANIAR